MITSRPGMVLTVGEAMIEMAVIGENTYRRSFAGDTFNTAWHMARILGPDHPVGFLTRIGTDSLSDAFLALMRADGLDITRVDRTPHRTMGLYMIELDGVERSFRYWRDLSAAQGLADDMDRLRGAVAGAELIHLSGITLAILSPTARETLHAVLSEARSQGARISFDPNVRPRLWASGDDIRATLLTFMALTDIGLPSHDDEKALWGDRSPEATLERWLEAGVPEIVVKNGCGSVMAASEGHQTTIETPSVQGVCDTTGAGDAFNAGYLSARLTEQRATAAVLAGQRVSAEVIRHFGAHVPKSVDLQKLVDDLAF